MAIRIKPYSEEWLIDFVENADLGEYKKNGNWLTLLCPFHDESNPSFGINIESGSYNCFSCGAKGSFVDLLDHLKIDIGSVPILDVPDTTKIRKKSEINEVKDDEYTKLFYRLNNSVQTKKILKYFRSRGIDNVGLLRTLKVGYIKHRHFDNRVVVPVFDESGKKVLWYEGRYLGTMKKSKYFRSESSIIREILYPYHLVKRSEKVVVVEGLFDVIKLLSFGIPALCMFGSVMHPGQIALLARFQKVILCFDNDKAGRKGIRKFRTEFFGPELPSDYYTLRLPRDINDLGEINNKQKVMKILQNKRLIK